MCAILLKEKLLSLTLSVYGHEETLVYKICFCGCLLKCLFFPGAKVLICLNIYFPETDPHHVLFKWNP